MARTQYEPDKHPTNSVIGKGLVIRASVITGAESIRVDGTIEGAVELDGALNLSESGLIEGSVRVTSAFIAGHVKGDIYCRTLLHLSSTSHVSGDIFTAAVVVDEGAVLRGRCRTGSADTDMLTGPVVIEA
jgi:cytoskeletal protein CcmA (bactofilin family)